MYATVADMQRVLPEKVKIGDSNIGVPVPGRSGNQGSKRSNLSPQEAQHYIEYASSYLDGRLRPYYSCPLRRIKSFETEILNDITSHTSVTVLVSDSGSFGLGNLVRFQNKDVMETSTITDVPSITSFVVGTVSGTYLVADNSRVSILEYPDPVPLVVAQMSAAFFLDTLFVSEQSPDVSNYAKTMRNIARSQIENILSGEVLLFGQEMTGRRFIRGSLLDAFKSPAEIQKGNEKE